MGVSGFKFNRACGRTTITDINEYAKERLLDPEWQNFKPFGSSMWEMYVEYWRCRHLPDVLVIPYEHMKKEPAIFLSLIAEFMRLRKPTGETHAKILELTSFQWMSKND